MPARLSTARFAVFRPSRRFASAGGRSFAAARLKNGRSIVKRLDKAAILSTPEIHALNAWEKNMRKRYQKGSLKQKNGKWLFQWYDINGKKKKRRFGSVSEVTKSEAQRMADKILGPINAAVSHASADTAFDQFVELEFFPWFRRKWKTSTRGTTEDRINRYEAATA